MKNLPADVIAELTNFYKSADKYGDRLESHTESAYEEYVSFVKRYLTKKDKVLDIGCGTGLSTFMLREDAARVVGLDISPIFIRVAEEKRSGPNIEFKCADVMKLPFPDESFDVVSSFLFIEHVCDVAGALSEMARVARKGGFIAILSPNLLSPFAELYNISDAIFGRKDNALGWKTQAPIKSAYLALYKTGILLGKGLSQKEDFIYRLPVLENKYDLSPDNDAVYLSNPIDLKIWFKRNGFNIIKYQRETIWGTLFPSFATGIHIVVKK